jgi:hypothetical protein
MRHLLVHLGWGVFALVVLELGFVVIPGVVR